MLEAAIGDGADEFWLQKKVLKSSGVDPSIAAFGGDFAGSIASLSLGAICGGGASIVGADFIIRVVDKVFLGVRHDETVDQLV
jgi:hypothetical protein